jgi:hypothetical protein
MSTQVSALPVGNYGFVCVLTLLIQYVFYKRSLLHGYLMSVSINEMER